MCLGTGKFNFFDAVKAKCPEKFAWECDDGMWVMGPIGDTLLKKLRDQGPQGTEVRRPPASPSWSCGTPSSPSSPSARRGKCTVFGSRCRQYDPVLFVPESLMDGLEVSSDLKSAAKRLMDEATSETADGRLELLPGLPPHEVYFEIYEPIPNGAPVFASERGGVLCRFRIREERWHRDVQGGSMKVTLKRLANLQFTCNEMLIPELLDWCDGYKAIKGKRMAEKASQLEEETELAKQRHKRSVERCRNPAQYRESAELVERGRLRAKKLGELAGKAVEQEIENAVEICKCGYHQIWHQGMAALNSLDCELSGHSFNGSSAPCASPPPRPRSSPDGESSLSTALISQSFNLGKEEAMVSGGRRLALQRVGSSMLAATFS